MKKNTGSMGDLLMKFSHKTGKMNEEFYFFQQVVCKYSKISPSPAGLRNLDKGLFATLKKIKSNIN